MPDDTAYKAKYEGEAKNLGLCGPFSNAGYRNGQALPRDDGSPTHRYGPGRHVVNRQIDLASGDVLAGGGSGRTTLYFPRGLVDLGFDCPDLKDCWGWGNGLIRASGHDIGIRGVTIEFPEHSFKHYGRTAGDQRGFNGLEFRECKDCWASDVHVVNADVGFYVHASENVTIEDTRVVANRDGSHMHYGISSFSSNILVNNLTAENPSNHGLTAQWGADGVYVNGTLIGGVRLEPEHNGPVARTLYKNIQGDIGSVQSRNRQKDPVSATFIDVGGESWGIPCDQERLWAR